MQIESIIDADFKQKIEQHIFNEIGYLVNSNPFNEEDVSRKLLLTTIISCTVLIISFLRILYLKNDKKEYT